MVELVRDWAVQTGLVHHVNGQVKPSAVLEDIELVAALKGKRRQSVDAYITYIHTYLQTRSSNGRTTNQT
jgi:hypothetical protein